MVSFATKTGASIRSDLKASTSTGAKWLRQFRDGKDCRVRFLQDMEDWLKYKEHYSPETKYFPCTNDASCPGCASDNERMKKPTRKYIAQALIVNERDAPDVGKVVALKLTVDLANRLMIKSDRNGGTLLDRDYTIIRTGNDKTTTYDVEVEDRSKIDITKYELVDVDAILAEMFESAWGATEVTPSQLVSVGVDDDPAPF